MKGAKDIIVLTIIILLTFCIVLQHHDTQVAYNTNNLMDYNAFIATYGNSFKGDKDVFRFYNIQMEQDFTRQKARF